MSLEMPEHEVDVVPLEHEGGDTGLAAAWCSTCSMWVGPHQDWDEEARPDVQRHVEAVRKQREHASEHGAVAVYDEHEAGLIRGMAEEDPESDWIFGAYYAHCNDCGGHVALGRPEEEEAAKEAREHRAAFARIAAGHS